jgi:large subunit ribosomal protein L24
MKLHTGDTVLVITGKDKGKTGQVIRVLTEKNHVVVQGLNMRVRHIKKTPQAAGSKIKFEASLDASKVMLLDPKSGKPTRIGYKIDEKGKKVRIAKVSGAVVVGAAKAKAPKKTAAKAGEKAETATPAVESPKLPAKRAFWKRGGDAPVAGDVATNDGESSAAASAANDSDMKHAPIVRRAGRGK